MTGTALVAGVGPRIGEAVVRELHGAGHDVALLARSTDFVDDLAAGLGDGALAVQGDVTDPASVESAVETVRAELGPVAVLVCNASGGAGNPVEDASVERLREIFDVRVAGSLACVQAVLPDLRETGGTVILSGTTYADGLAEQQVEWGAVAPAARGLATTLDEALPAVQVTYVRIGTAVRPPDRAGPEAVGADEIAATYRHLVEQDRATTRECTVLRRDG